jgi:hypothetical protein
MRWVGHVVCLGEVRIMFNIVGRLSGKRPPLRPRHRWEDTTKMGLKRSRVWRV